MRRRPQRSYQELRARWHRSDEPGFADAVAHGYRSAGGALPADWRRRALYEDLLAWAGFLGRPRVGEAIVADARRMIARTLAVLGGSVG